MRLGGLLLSWGRGRMLGQLSLLMRVSVERVGLVM
jgi:hypothetical protein